MTRDLTFRAARGAITPSATATRSCATATRPCASATTLCASALRLCAAAALLLCLMPAAAGADVFGPISLVSAGALGGERPQQAEYAHDAAISGNGQYVVFDGSFAGQTGVWRRELASGAIEQVAGGDAELPSVSQEGRYISFTSSEDLVPADEASGPNVWVRDMDPGPGEPEYVLASAVNESNKGLTYEYGANPTSEEKQYGSAAVGRSAISANGNEVAFVTTAVSDLVTAHTPALQVAVRYLDEDRTVLVSRCFECADTDEPVSGLEGEKTYGALYPGSASKFGFQPPPANGEWEEDPPPGASISADGSTVAWMGEDIGEQAQMLPDERPLAVYTEPLWRRIQPGSETPTERVTGGSDPLDPACLASGETALPQPEDQSAADPCQGPFEVEVTAGGQSGSVGIWPERLGNFVPRLSADGYTVAFMSGALPIGFGLGFADSGRSGPSNLYVADMRPGLTRVQALTPLTELGGVGVAAADPITDFEISPDGSQVAFTTRRTEFPLGSPAYISPIAAEAGESELFDADLGNDTLTRVTHGYDGEPSEQAHGSKLACASEEDAYCAEPTEGAQSPSFSTGGEELAFSSTASNLAYGDGNGPHNPLGAPEGEFDGSDAFVIERKVFSPLPTPQYISPLPEPSIVPAWQLGVTALSRPNGSVLLYVEVPGSGTLRAQARGTVRVKSTVRAAGRRGAGRPSRLARETIATRTLAASTKLLRAGGESVQLVLTLAKPYAALAARGGGLSAGVSLTFTAPGHSELHQTIEVTFARTARSARRARKQHRAGHRGDRR